MRFLTFNGLGKNIVYQYVVDDVTLLYMLRAMTKPALMTSSNIEAINFYFNAKLTDFAMFSY